MTAGQFGEVDFDLLADYVGGALTDAPVEAEVARLIATVPAWSQAYAELVTAMETVQGSLASWGDIPEVMPSDVTDRLTAALAAAGPIAAPPGPGHEAEPDRVTDRPEVAVDRPDLAADRPDLTADRPDVVTDRSDRVTDRAAAAAGSPGQPGTDVLDRPGRGPAVVPGDETRGPGRRAVRSRRRWSRLAGPVAIAAAVAAFSGFGISRLTGSDSQQDTASAPRGAGAEHLPNNSNRSPDTYGTPRVILELPNSAPLASGSDYTPGTLANRVTALGKPSITVEGAEGGPDLAPEPGRVKAVGGLHRLADTEALTTCLHAVATDHAGGQLTVNFVDYASFQGSPAVVVSFTDGAGARWVWVVGPECGVSSSGADTRYRTRVG
ncbi:hypothetical protein GCM10027290_33650 [Micromonospora sonneratiae]|uniref:Uncharacterized protein n=1 Tax=Micromonospora sonneratiae TaxID=1184706 RepID=A0ABW3YMB4_9ACTN